MHPQTISTRKEKVMLTIFSDSLFTATRVKRWDAPEHWTENGRARRKHDIDRDAMAWRLRAIRGGKK